MESGILELYVLGQLNAQEQAEVEGMIAKYPAIKQEIEAIEYAMEQYAQHNALQPPAAMEGIIMERIGVLKQETPVKEAMIVPLAPVNKGSVRLLRLALIASIMLLLASLVALFTAHQQLNDAKDQIANLNLEKEKFTNTVSFMKQANADLQKITGMMNNPDWKIVKLSGTEMDPSAHMIVYWNVSGKHVMMDNSKMNLPANDEAHQYQLWALVDGKPVDLGVFDVKANATHILVNMKEITSAQTFAVTLEKRGGSASPTMTKMIVAGNVAI